MAKQRIKGIFKTEHGGESVDKEAMILSHINEIDEKLNHLTRRGHVEGWTSYTELQKAKSIALLALATLKDKETK
ncbi:hypothetical protein P9850_12750 [Anoxybacillus rupiensis]|uniref:Uncharacterized protein n=1 Tax=Anoxybacteroides rupiense TaxID=311460 RepID=A0ABD5IYH8_9BACL|nr:hypothetical protein [Anoxybacillus rupiensis]